MDRAISKSDIQFEQRKKIVKVSIIIGSFILCIFFLLSLMKPTLKRNEVLTAKTFRGSIEETIFSIGTIIPNFEESIISPIQSKINTIRKSTGTKIKKGESILGIDKTQVLSNFNKLNDEYELKLNKEKQLKLRLERELIELKSRSEIKKLEIESLITKRTQQQKLFDIGAGSEESLNVSILKYKIAVKEDELLVQKIGNQEKSLSADLNEIRLEVQIQKRKIDEVVRLISLAEITSSIDGVVSWVEESIGKRINSGDILAKVTQENSFKLKGELSESNVGKIYVSQEIMFDVSGETYSGKILSINPSVNAGLVTYIARIPSGIKDIRSNLKLDTHIVLSKKNSVILVKNGSFFTGKSTQGIFIVDGNTARKRHVEIGVSGSKYIEFVTQIKENETIIISNMEEYDHLDEVEIK